ncbi:hypothetical protein V1506DRAFT_547513 [Lipomyces tetrasporus]
MYLNRAEFHRACGGFLRLARAGHETISPTLRLLAFIRQFGIVGHIVTVMSRW